MSGGIEHLLRLVDQYRIDVTLSTVELDGVRHPWGYCPHVTNDEGYIVRESAIIHIPLRDALTDITCPACRNAYGPNVPDWLTEYLHPLIAADHHRHGRVDAATARAFIGPTPLLTPAAIERLLRELPPPTALRPGPVQYVTRPLLDADDPALRHFDGGFHHADGRSIINGVASTNRAVPLGELPDDVDPDATIDVFYTLIRDNTTQSPADLWATSCRLAR